MNRIVAFAFSLLFTLQLSAQAPHKMSYQAVVRDASNNLVTDQPIGMRISILQGSVAGSAVFVETHTPLTNANGLVNIEIGMGAVELGGFTAIDWTNGPYFIQKETDPTGGINYSIVGTSELLSVPYALYAATSGNSTPGPQGDPGTNGANSLVLTTPEPAGVNCSTGGVKMEYGLDLNYNSILDTWEVNSSLTNYVCNGLQGATGPQGPAGPLSIPYQEKLFNFFSSNVRDQWVYSTDSLIVNSGGFYLIMYTGKGSDLENGYGSEVDVSTYTQVYRVLWDSGVTNSVDFTKLYYDEKSTGASAHYHHALDFFVNGIFYLNTGDVLKLRAFAQTSVGGVPTANWQISNATIKLIKLN